MNNTLIALSLCFVMTCAADVGEGRQAATVEDATTTPTAPAATGTTIDVDVARSSIKALGAKVTAQHPIDFKTFTGKVSVDKDSLTALSFTVEMSSLESDVDRLTKHLKNEDFFDVNAFPQATFSSTGIEAGASADGFTHTVSGDLTMRGNTKRVTFPAKVSVTEQEVVASTEFVINRQDFGITYPGMKDDLIQDNVAITVAFVAPRS